MKKEIVFIIMFLMNIFYASAQITPVADSVLSTARKEYLKKLYLKCGCGSSHISLYDTHSDSDGLDVVKKHIPYNYHIISSTKTCFELRESEQFERLVVVYFIHIKENDASLFKKHNGQGSIDSRVVPTTYFWNLKGNVLIFTIVEEIITDYIKNCLPLD
jgi:hypothetical protein